MRKKKGIDDKDFINNIKTLKLNIIFRVKKSKSLKKKRRRLKA